MRKARQIFNSKLPKKKKWEIAKIPMYVIRYSDDKLVWFSFFYERVIARNRIASNIWSIY